MQEKGKRDGTIVEHGTFTYWEQLFGGVLQAILADKLDENSQYTLRDSPRNFFHLVAARWSEEERFYYPELANPRAFTTFLRGCMEGGEHHERSQRYFKVEDVGRKKVEMFKLVFDLDSLPDPILTREEYKERERLAANLIQLPSPSSGVTFGGTFKEDLATRLEREFHENARKYDLALGSGDPNFDAEAACESQD
jgi:hypothetical protein